MIGPRMHLSRGVGRVIGSRMHPSTAVEPRDRLADAG
jgi:hypothetical protein